MPTWFKMLLSIIAVLIVGAIGNARQEQISKDNLARKVLIEEPKQPRLEKKAAYELTPAISCDDPINWVRVTGCILQQDTIGKRPYVLHRDTPMKGKLFGPNF